MRRHSITPRPNWQQILEKSGFHYHTGETPYWDESHCYEFSYKEIETLEQATNELQTICAEAVQTVLDRNWLSRIGIHGLAAKMVQESWDQDHLSLYGRFDLSWNSGHSPKMLEYNADTPTSLFEAAAIQWFWMKETKHGKDQFNSIHERLIGRWRQIAKSSEPLHFTCMRDNLEDRTQVEYLRDTALQAGFEVIFEWLTDLGHDSSTQRFVDTKTRPISQCFKLYPWEWLLKDEFGQLISNSKIHFFEPAWKQVMSSKAFLPLLWELYPEHPNLLPAWFEKPASGKFVEKPFQSREGMNIKVYQNETLVSETEGIQEASGVIYQAYHELPKFQDRHVVIGSWIIGEESAGIGLRESVSPITENTSQFVPHFIGDH